MQEYEPASSSLASLQGDGETVLLVEDHKEMMEFCASMLKQNGYTVIAAENYAEGLQAFEKYGVAIRLVLSDVVLPDRNGIELAKELCSRSPGLPIILTSGYADKQSEWPVIHERCYAFLQKPFTVVALLQTLKNALARQR